MAISPLTNPYCYFAVKAYDGTQNKCAYTLALTERIKEVISLRFTCSQNEPEQLAIQWTPPVHNACSEAVQGVAQGPHSFHFPFERVEEAYIHFASASLEFNQENRVLIEGLFYGLKDLCQNTFCNLKPQNTYLIIEEKAGSQFFSNFLERSPHEFFTSQNDDSDLSSVTGSEPSPVSRVNEPMHLFLVRAHNHYQNQSVYAMTTVNRFAKSITMHFKGSMELSEHIRHLLPPVSSPKTQLSTEFDTSYSKIYLGEDDFEKESVKEVHASVVLPPATGNHIEDLKWMTLIWGIAALCHKVFPNMKPKHSTLLLHRGFERRHLDEEFIFPRFQPQ